MTVFEGWQFRTSNPTFEAGEEVELYATGYDPDRGALIARVGDTVIRIPEGSADDVDRRLRLRVSEFSGDTGQAELLGVSEEQEF